MTMEAPTIQLSDVFNAAAEFVDRHLGEGRAGRIALRYEGGTFTYGQVAEAVNRVGNALRALGVEMENRVLLLLYDSPEFVASFFGAIKIGAVPVTVNTMMRAQDYEYFLYDSGTAVSIMYPLSLHDAVTIRALLTSHH